MIVSSNNEIESFSKNGYVIFNVENHESLNTLHKAISSVVGNTRLCAIHEEIELKQLNDVRLSGFKKINSINGWERIYASLAKSRLKELLGPDIAIQSKLNLSMQLPNDESSILGLHTDALSGQSVFEIVLWVPLTNAYESNSMYIFPPHTTYEMLARLPSVEVNGMGHIFEEYIDSAEFITIEYGQAMIFTPTMFHGNILNTTDASRVSINCRFKNIFSTESEVGERRLGSFYRILELSAITDFGLSYRDDYLSFS